MNQITLTTYSFDELSDKAKQRAREWFRQGNEFDHEPTIEDAKQCLAHAGFDISRIYYSGFWSQGDGACFEGTWRASNVSAAAMKEHAPKDEELHRIVDGLAAIVQAFPHASLRVKHRGHYYHQYCTEFDVTFADPDLSDTGRYATPDDGELTEGTAMTIERLREDRAREDMCAAEEQLIKLSRDAMAWIYRQLEKDYNWHNSDEQVDESIRANDYAFTVEGKRFVTL